MAESIFEIDGDAFVPTVLARGPWSRDAQHGGAPAALLARALERTGAAGRLVRLTVEFVRPVPMAPLAVEARLARTGRQVQRSEAVMSADGREVARAEGLHLRERPLDVAIAPPLMTRSGERPLPGLDAGRSFQGPPGSEYDGFHRGGVEIRMVEGNLREPGPASAWFRLAVPLVPGETPSPMSRAAAACDFGNGIASVLSWDTHTFVNPDLVISLFRDPVGEWVGIDAVTHAGLDGTGVAECRVYDGSGAAGISQQSLLFDPRR